MSLYKWQVRTIGKLRQGVSLMMACRPGAGKTRPIVKWLELENEVHAIIVAPTLVIYDTWVDEFEGSNIRYAHAHGSTFEEACQVFVDDGVDVLLTTPEMLVKIEAGKRGVLRKCRKLIIDESSKYKNAGSSRFKSIQRILKQYHRIDQRVCMSGSLLPKHYLQIFGPMWIVGGTDLFKTNKFSEYRDTYFYTKPYKEFEYIMFPGFQDKLEARIAPFIIQPDEDDYADMPPLIEVVHHVNIGKKNEAYHKAMAKDLVITVGDDDVIAANSGVALFKRAQICSGIIYKYTDPNDPESGREEIYLHSRKHAILKSIVEEAESNVLIFYSTLSTRNVIRKLYPNSRELKSKKNISDWKAGKIEVAFGHPASMGHGLNLQTGGNVIIWYDLTPDAEIWWQAIKRLHRGAITEPVYVHYLQAYFKGSTDIYLLEMLHKKYAKQEGLLGRLKSLET